LKATTGLLTMFPAKEPEPVPLPICMVPAETVAPPRKETSLTKVTVPTPDLANVPEATIEPPVKT